MPDASAPVTFGDGWSDRLHHARYVVGIPPHHAISNIEWPAADPDPKTSFVTLDAVPLSEAQFRDQVAARDAKTRDNLGAGIFVHGFNASFQESVFRAAQLATDSDIGDAIALFAWPSAASPIAYVPDKDASLYSRDGLAHVIGTLAKDRRIRRIVVVGHSMGGWLTMEALRQLRLSGQGEAINKLGDVILAAPDIDVDVFSKQLGVLGRLTSSLTVMLSNDDGALSISSFLSRGRPRVGLADISDPGVQQAAKDYGVRIIDIAAIENAGDLNHGRYAAAAAIYPKLAAQLASRTRGGLAGGAVYLLRPLGPRDGAIETPPRTSANAVDR